MTRVHRYERYEGGAQLLRGKKVVSRDILDIGSALEEEGWEVNLEENYEGVLFLTATSPDIVIRCWPSRNGLA